MVAVMILSVLGYCALELGALLVTVGYLLFFMEVLPRLKERRRRMDYLPKHARGSEAQ
jgi:hypothetical protein